MPFQGFPCCCNCIVEAHVCRVGNVTHLRLLLREHPELATYRGCRTTRKLNATNLISHLRGLRVLVTTQTEVYSTE
jgi:hypothetical protein